MTTPVGDENDYYSTSFMSTSFGTEQELSGVTIKMPEAGLPNIVAVVWHAGVVLAAITKDVEQQNSPNTHTIELRTTPAELDNEQAWCDRLRAMWVAVQYVGTKRENLEGDEYEGFETEVLIPGAALSGGTVGDGGRQATVGIQASELGTDLSDTQVASGHLHEHLDLPWYVHSFSTMLPDRAREEQIAFALMMSATLKLATIWSSKQAYKERVNLLEVKNLWQVRPRTPFSKIYEAFPGSEDEMLGASLEYQLPSLVPTDWGGCTNRIPSVEMWQAARKLIFTGGHLGGHTPPEALIQYQPALLFEYRSVGATQFDGKFWDPRATFDNPVTKATDDQ
jgi:hypothetical protein